MTVKAADPSVFPVFPEMRDSLGIRGSAYVLTTIDPKNAFAR